MSINMDLDAFKKELELIIKGLLKKGLLPADTNIKELAVKVTEKLSHDKDLELNLADLKNVDIQKSLGLACMAEANPKNKFDYTLLFKNQLDLDKKEFEKQLKSIFSELLKLKPKNKMTASEEDELKKELDALAERLAEKLIKNDNQLLAENHQVFDLLAPAIDLLSDQRRRHYGVDTTIAGGIFIPVLAEPLSDQLNSLPAAGETYEGSTRSADPGKPDYLGCKIALLFIEESSGSLVRELGIALRNQGIISSIPEPHPPGTQAH